MREIKFRAWAEDHMVYLTNAGLQYFDFEGSYALSFVVDGYSGFWGHEHYENCSKLANTFPVMQFTGLKDKNGVEIYEGDLLRNAPQNDWDKTNYAAHEVFFHDGDEAYGGIGWKLGRTQYYGSVCGGAIWPFIPKQTARMTVCGNIYNNEFKPKKMDKQTIVQAADQYVSQHVNATKGNMPAGYAGGLWEGFKAGAEYATPKWIPVSEGAPDSKEAGEGTYVWCLVIKDREILLRPWNVYHLCFDGEDMDDHDFDLDAITHYMYLTSLPNP